MVVSFGFSITRQLEMASLRRHRIPITVIRPRTWWLQSNKLTIHELPGQLVGSHPMLILRLRVIFLAGKGIIRLLSSRDVPKWTGPTRIYQIT